MTHDPAWTGLIPVTADTPGRGVIVSVDWPGVADADARAAVERGDRIPWQPRLAISGDDSWTWLAPDEARAVAAALTQAASRAEALRAGDDPRDA
jgi:hypothetical protein